ncbi:LOB domain-containing protein 20-like [Gastrolobium bilobum]|uniref:LOB domain-containing protein 20-like n=1 Tax=Gastrolobium bilobum TaxID=150636 RepID=UPI002AB054DB|nr:LOB domain-containing protein 20-like [Gastrolobium bilobum]
MNASLCTCYSHTPAPALTFSSFSKEKRSLIPHYSPCQHNHKTNVYYPTTSHIRINITKILFCSLLPTQEFSPLMASPTAPCGACKFLRRKCIEGCIFAPYFSSDQGAAKFAAVHKVFGASNVSKLLLSVPVNHRHEAAETISYEAQERLSDPVYGCVSTIIALQQQVASLQAEVTMMRTHVINSRFGHSSALQQQQQQLNMNVGLQPAYYNNSFASINHMNPSSFNPGFDHAMGTASSSHSLEPLQLSGLSQYEEEDEERRFH